MRTLIITADDLGITKGINEGILLAYKMGIVTDTSVLVNAPAFPDAVKMVKRNRMPVGLHINITAYSPVSPLDKVRTLCKDRQFYRPNLSNWDFSFLNTADPKEIEKEIWAQFNLFRKKLGFLPSHLSSHKCEHGDPKVLNVVKNIALKFRIPVRIPYWNFNPNYAAESELRRAGVIMPDSLAPISTLDGFDIDMESIDSFIKILPEGSTEVITLPGFVDQDILRTTSWQWQRARALALLVNPALMEKFKNSSIKLISFKELKAKKRQPY